MGHWRGGAGGVWLVGCGGWGGGSLGGGPPTGTGGNVGTGRVRGGGGLVGTGGGGSGPTNFCREVDVPFYAPSRPAVLLLVDRSRSMNDDSNEMSCTGGGGAPPHGGLLSPATDTPVTPPPRGETGLGPVCR